MCGISFIHHSGQDPVMLCGRMKSSLKVLSHRGPDENNIWAENDTVIGHCRLSIIDLSSSKQPMCDPANRYVLSYNGEIYNYLDVRESLKHKWSFRTNGDTEVLLAGLIIEGVEVLKRLDGMWAFALWDNRKKSLVLGRDRMGKKPLYYNGENRRFLCSSELPALRCLDYKQWQEDEDSTADYFRYGYYLPGFTAYNGIREVLPGHCLEWSESKGIRQSRYWHIPLQQKSTDKPSAVRELSESIFNAVHKRKIADVEIGSFLSGGVDSSIITAILAQNCPGKLKTFTIGFDDPSYDESKYSQKVSQYCKTDHYMKSFGDFDKKKLLTLLFNHVGQPFCDSSLLPTRLVSESAAEKVKVALSGDGGDELFCGYERYRARVIMQWYDRLPVGIKKAVSSILGALPETTDHHSRSLIKKAILFDNLIKRIDSEKPYFAPVLFDRQNYDELTGSDLSMKGHEPPDMIEETSLSDIEQMMYSDCLIYLPQDILQKVDRASMSCSLETRAPFLDHKVVENSFKYPLEWHIGFAGGKKMLQECFSDILPPWIWKRKKQGFAVPVHAWFKGSAAFDLRELLNNVETIINNRKVEELLGLHMSGKRDLGHHLWTIFLYYLWKSDRRSLLNRTT